MSDDSFSSHFDVEVECHDEQPADHSDLDWCSYKHCLVEHSGFEPLTPTLPVLCATSCANAPYESLC